MARALGRTRMTIRGLDWMTLLPACMERMIAQIPPEVNCALFLVGFYLGVSFLLPHLSWYGIPQAPPGWIAESHRMLMKMSIFLVLVAAIALIAPGRAHRRLFSACAFPLLALVAMLVHDVSLPLVSCVLVFRQTALDTLFHAAALGLVLALVVSIPVALLFRGTCLPAVLLIVLPGLAKEQSAALRSMQSNATVWPMATLLVEAVIVAVCTYGIYRYLCLPCQEGRPDVGQ
jgi:hypothetical protein